MKKKNYVLSGSELASSKADQRSCAVAEDFFRPVNETESQGEYSKMRLFPITV